MKLNTHIDLSALVITDYRLSVASHSLVALVDNKSIYVCNLVLKSSPSQTDNSCKKLMTSTDPVSFETLLENTKIIYFNSTNLIYYDTILDNVVINIDY